MHQHLRKKGVWFMYTENGSGGSRTGVLTTFEDGDDYRRRLNEIRIKVDRIDAFLGQTALTEKAPPTTTRDWIGREAIRPQFDRPLDEVTSLYRPMSEIPDIRNNHN